MEKKIKAVKAEKEKKGSCGMKWHCCLCIMLLFAAIVNIFSGIFALTGFKHEINSCFGNTIMFPEMVYGEFPALRALDLISGIAMLVMAVFQIIIFALLSKRMKIAPLLLNIMVSIMCALCAVYDLFFTVFVNIENKPIYGEMVLKASLYYDNASTTAATAVVIAVIFWICSRRYYKNRI